MTLKNKKMDGNCLVEEEKDTLEFCVTLGTLLPLAVTVSPAHCTSAPHETMGTDNPAVHLVTPQPWLLDSAVYCFRGWGGSGDSPSVLSRSSRRIEGTQGAPQTLRPWRQPGEAGLKDPGTQVTSGSHGHSG